VERASPCILFGPGEQKEMRKDESRGYRTGGTKLLPMKIQTLREFLERAERQKHILSFAFTEARNGRDCQG